MTKTRINEVSDLHFKAKRRKAVAMNGVGKATVGLVDSINISVIYALFLKPILFNFLEQIGKYFLFPIAAAASVVHAILAWRQAYIEKGKMRSVVSAVVETVSALAITTAVIGALIASTIFALITPIIFTAVMGGKTLFHMGSTIYYLGKAEGSAIESKKASYRALAKEHAIASAAGIVATAGVIGVFLLGKTFLAGIGIAAGIIGSVLAVKYGYQSFIATREISSEPVSDEQTSQEDYSQGKKRKQNIAVSPLIVPEKTKKYSSARTIDYSKPKSMYGNNITLFRQPTDIDEDKNNFTPSTNLANSI